MSETEKTHPKLTAALVKAQAMMEAAKKDATNPAFARGPNPKAGRYADLAAVAEALHEPFSKNGLGWRHKQKSDPAGVYVKCIIFHESGEELEPEDWMFLPVPQQTPQAYGSGFTYGRRYTLQGAAGVVSDDDDGNEASAQTVASVFPKKAATQLPVPIGEEMTEGERIAAEYPPHLQGELTNTPAETVTPEGAYGPVLDWPDKHKGKHASELSADELRFLIQHESKKLNDKSKPAWMHKKAKNLLDGLLSVRATKFGPYSEGGH